MIFAESTNTQAYLKAGFMGFTGSGKTYTAKEIAVGLWKRLAERGLPGGSAPIFFLDTETGSDWVVPSIVASTGRKPHVAKTRVFKDLVPAIREVEKVKGILVIDSITHFWRELTESYAKKMNRKRGLRFDDWSWLKGPDAWGSFTDTFVNSNCHILMCGRAGFEYDFFEDDDGKKELEKTGIKMKAEAETGYEPSILIYMERWQDITKYPIAVWRTATVLKDRSTLLDGKRFKNPTFQDFIPHIDFLNLGGDQLGVDTTRNSESMIGKPEYSDRAAVDKERDALLEEIQELLVKHYPSKTGSDKTTKSDLLEKHARTRSWERLTMLPPNDLRAIYDSLLVALENRHADGRVVEADPFSGEMPNGAEQVAAEA